MKSLKRFAALLLAGAMALLMLTACGGGGGGTGTRNKTAENAVLAKIKDSGLMATTLSNDPALCAIAEDHLDRDIKKDLAGKFSILGAECILDVHVDGKEESHLIITATARYTGGKLTDAILNYIQQELKKQIPNTNVDVKANNSWASAGVVVKSNGKNTYLAVTFKIQKK